MISWKSGNCKDFQKFIMYWTATNPREESTLQSQLPTYLHYFNIWQVGVGLPQGFNFLHLVTYLQLHRSKQAWQGMVCDQMVPTLWSLTLGEPICQVSHYLWYWNALTLTSELCSVDQVSEVTNGLYVLSIANWQALTQEFLQLDFQPWYSRYSVVAFPNNAREKTSPAFLALSKSP